MIEYIIDWICVWWFAGHYLDQKRLKQGLYRHPWDDIAYLNPDPSQLWGIVPLPYITPPMKENNNNFTAHLTIIKNLSLILFFYWL